MASAGPPNTSDTLKPIPSCCGSNRFEKQYDNVHMVLLSMISHFIYLHIGIH